MPINIHILSASKDIGLYSEELKSTTEATVALVEKLLPIKDVDIVFL